MTTRSALRYRPLSESKEPASVPTRRASRQRDQSTRTRPPRPIPADVETDEQEIQADVQPEDQEISTGTPFNPEEDDLTVFHPIPERRKGSRPGSASVPPSRSDIRRERSTQQDQPKRRRRVHPVVLILVGMLLLWLGYTGIWGAKLGLSHLGNSWRFGGHPATDSLVATVDGKTTRVIATNSGRQISVYIFLGGDKVQILAEPLDPSAWGSDTDEVVPALSVDHGRLTLQLTGDPQYGGKMDQLQETFAITPTASGYQIERTA